MCLLPKLSTDQVLRRLWLIQVSIVFVMVYMASGFVGAQSQDYLNGQFNEQIKALGDRVDNIEDILKYIATGVFGTLGVTLWRTLLDFQREKNRRQETES